MALKTLFKQTAIYGLATVLPRVLSFLLVRLHTGENVLQSTAQYGDVSLIYSYFVLFNVVLAYGMETTFFRFFNKEPHPQKVISTSAISLIISSVLFLIIGLLFQQQIADWTNLKVEYIRLVVWILLLDALVIIPFAWLRANQKALRYALLKIINVLVNVGLNLFLLLSLKNLASETSFWSSLYKPGWEVNYIFIANLIASALTLVLLLPFYLKIKYTFDSALWKKMMRYALPVLIAGVAFSINEAFDRILLERLLPENIAKSEIGIYSACYKLAVFMTLFATAYKLGVEPYFFSHAKEKNPQKNYALILEYFVIFGSVILLGVVVFADVLKVLLIGDETYWQAMTIVPVILLANLCLGIYHNLSVWYKITDKTLTGAYISIVGAIITLVANILLIPHIGYIGSALATLAAYGTMMICSYFLGKKHYPIPYNLPKIGLYMGSSILFSALTFYVFDRNIWVGIPLLLIFLTLVFFVEKNRLKSIFLKNEN